MYPAELVIPMKKELTDFGFQDLITPEQVDTAIKNTQGTLLIVVNSVCGCAAGAARPGVKAALQQSEKKPNALATVFAGFDMDAVSQVRKHSLPFPPSSPSIALFKDGKLIHFVERHQIEGRPAHIIADHMLQVFNEYC